MVRLVKYLCVIAGLLNGFGLMAQSDPIDIERVSVNSSEIEGDSYSRNQSISADGRYVAFTSYSTNLVSGDTNGVEDVFVRDRQTGETTRVSVSDVGAEGDDASWYPSISADGRYVAFVSYATNLISGDTNGKSDVFVHDRQTGETARVSVSDVGAEGNDASWYPSISMDGRYVAFASYASDLVAGDSNGGEDIFVHDRQTGITTRVSVDSAGVEADGWSKTLQFRQMVVMWHLNLMPQI